MIEIGAKCEDAMVSVLGLVSRSSYRNRSFLVSCAYVVWWVAVGDGGWWVASRISLRPSGDSRAMTP